jgi:hypothetical protein
MKYQFIPAVSEAHRVSVDASEARHLLMKDRLGEKVIDHLALSDSGWVATNYVNSSQNFQAYLSRVEIDFKTGEAALAFMQWAQTEEKMK